MITSRHVYQTFGCLKRNLVSQLVQIENELYETEKNENEIVTKVEPVQVSKIGWFTYLAIYKVYKQKGE